MFSLMEVAKGRPQGWTNPHHQEDNSHTLPGEDKYCYKAFEKGASDMLGLLIFYHGWYFEENHPNAKDEDRAGIRVNFLISDEELK